MNEAINPEDTVTMAMMIVAWVTGSVLTSKTNLMTSERKIYPPKRNGAGVRARWRGTTPEMASGGNHGRRKGGQEQSAARSDLPNSLKGS